MQAAANQNIATATHLNTPLEMSASEEPILARINRLDAILKQLEDIRGGEHHSPKSSYASTTSSGTLTSDGHPPWSPERLEKRCRPLNEVMMEVEEKGNLIDRLLHAEDRILKVCLQLEEEFESERSREMNENGSSSAEKSKLQSPKKGLKQFVKSCVRVKPKHHHKPTTSS